MLLLCQILSGMSLLDTLGVAPVDVDAEDEFFDCESCDLFQALQAPPNIALEEEFRMDVEAQVEDPPPAAVPAARPIARRQWAA